MAIVYKGLVYFGAYTGGEEDIQTFGVGIHGPSGCLFYSKQQSSLGCCEGVVECRKAVCEGRENNTIVEFMEYFAIDVECFQLFQQMKG